MGSGHDPTVREFKPHIRLSVVSEEPPSDPLSPSLSAPHMRSFSLSQKQINIKEKEGKVIKIQIKNMGKRHQADKQKAVVILVSNKGNLSYQLEVV